MIDFFPSPLTFNTWKPTIVSCHSNFVTKMNVKSSFLSGIIQVCSSSSCQRGVIYCLPDQPEFIPPGAEHGTYPTENSDNYLTPLRPCKNNSTRSFDKMESFVLHEVLLGLQGIPKPVPCSHWAPRALHRPSDYHLRADICGHHGRSCPSLRPPTQRGYLG